MAQGMKRPKSLPVHVCGTQALLVATSATNAKHTSTIAHQGNLIIRIQAYGQDLMSSTTAHRDANWEISNNLPSHCRGVDPASALANVAQGRYGPASTHGHTHTPPGP